MMMIDNDYYEVTDFRSWYQQCASFSTLFPLPRPPPRPRPPPPGPPTNTTTTPWLCFANEDQVEEVHVSCRHAL